MKNHSFFTVLVILCVLDFSYCRKQYSHGGTGYILRLFKINSCPDSPNSGRFTYVKLENRNCTQFVEAEVIIESSRRLSEMQIWINRCLDYNQRCEKLLNWKIPDPCVVLKMKNQLWTSFVESLKPNTWLQTCPLVSKGTYHISKTPFNVDPLIRMLPGATKYYFTTKFVLRDENDVIICAYAEYYIQSYTKRVSI